MIRTIEKEDVDGLYDIWEKFYKNEFSFPNFFNKFLCAFVVVDDNNGKVITAGGVRLITESILITNKDLPVRARIRALLQILEASKFVAGASGYNNLNALVHDQEWKKHLIKHGFIASEMLSLEL